MEDIKTCARRFTAEQVVKITLEGTTQPFYVQKALLCNASDYFTTALDSKFKEGLDQALTLPGCDEDTFEMFLYWLCNRKIPNTLATLDKKDKPTWESAVRKAQETLVNLWCFADSVLMRDLQDETMQALLVCLKKTSVKATALKETFRLTTEGSLLRNAMMDELAHEISEAYSGRATGLSVIKKLPEDELEILAAIPGLLTDLFTRMLKDSSLRHKGATQRDQIVYMVRFP